MHVLLNPRQFLERLRLAGFLATPPGAVRIVASTPRESWLHAGNPEYELSLRVPLLKVLTPGSAGLPAKELGHWLRGMKAGSVSVELRHKEETPSPAKLVLSGPRCFAALPVPENATAVRRPAGRLQTLAVLRAWRLRRLIRQTLFASTEEGSRYALDGCHVSQDAGNLNFAATDGHRLAHAFEPMPTPTTAPMKTRKKPRPARSQVVPSRVLRILFKLCEHFENAEVTLGFTARGRFRAEARDFRLSSKTLRGRFPPWQELLAGSVIPNVPGLEPLDLLRSLRTDRGTEPGNEPVEMRPLGRSLVLGQADRGLVTHVPLRGTLDPSVEGVVAVLGRAYLVDFLNVATGPFTLILPNGEEQPLRFEGEGFRYFIMPGKQHEAPDAEAAEAMERPIQQPSQQPPAEESPHTDRHPSGVKGNGSLTDQVTTAAVV